MKDVAKLYIYYHGDGVQREFYAAPGPAATSIRVSGFAFEDLLIEIEAFAICRD